MALAAPPALPERLFSDRTRQIGSEIYYPRPMHMQECFPPSDGVRVSLPISEHLAEESLSIPIFPELRQEQQDAVITAIGEFLRG